MKLAERILMKIEEANLMAIADQLQNNEEVTADDLVEIAKVKKDKAQSIIKAWFAKDPIDRNNMDTADMKAWLKDKV
jgi:hypothetical protein